MNVLLGSILNLHIKLDHNSKSKRHSRTYAVIYTKKYLLTRIHSNTESPRNLAIKVPSIHAEMNAIAELRRSERRGKPKKGEKRLLIARVTPGIKFAQAKQCIHCCRGIVECGIVFVSNTNNLGELDVSVGRDIQVNCYTSLGWKTLQNRAQKR